MTLPTVKILHAAMWIGVIAIAFMFQVIPLLLVLTLLGMALGISSPVVLVALPLVLPPTVRRQIWASGDRSRSASAGTADRWCSGAIRSACSSCRCGTITGCA